MMELRHKGVRYTFDYDYTPNTEEDRTHRTTLTRSGRGLDGSVNVIGICRNGRSTPVPVELLNLMEDAAAEHAIASGCPTVSDSHLELLRRLGLLRRSRAAGSRRLLQKRESRTASSD
jgi:hypothetical protein